MPPDPPSFSMQNEHTIIKSESFHIKRSTFLLKEPTQIKVWLRPWSGTAFAGFLSGWIEEEDSECFSTCHK